MFAHNMRRAVRPFAPFGTPASNVVVRFFRVKKQKEHYTGLKSDLLDHLDIDRAKTKHGDRKMKEPQVSKVTRKKMNLDLDTPEKEHVDSIAHSIMDTNGFNMCEVLNDAIEKTNFDIQISEMHKSMGLSIEEVVETVDRGKVTAYWSAPEMDKFLQFAHEKDPKSSRQMTKLFKKNISELLQKKEPRFRAYLVKKMDFRRVPKIDFLPQIDDDQENTESAARQAFLREQARANFDVDAGDNNDDGDYFLTSRKNKRSE